MLTDLPPLFAPGFHQLTLEDLHTLAVAHPRLRLSTSRPLIMRHLWTLAACLCRWEIGTELWIDGSFLTEKIDPGDVDLVLVLAPEFEDRASEEQLAILDWWEDSENEPGELFMCHTFSAPRASPGSPDHDVLAEAEQYWIDFFGTGRDGKKKGIGRILLPDGCV